MTNAEAYRRIEIMQQMMRDAGLRWGQLTLELGPNGEVKHVNSTMEVVPDDPHDIGKS